MTAPPVVMELRIHPTAIVSKGAEIGPGVKIGPYAFVGPEAVAEGFAGTYTR